jgi:hypothetical protein
MIAAAACFACLGTAASVRAAPVPATAEDLAFFVGQWATGPAPVDGYETISAQSPDCARAVRIEAGPDDRLVRTVMRRDGQDSSAAFRVMRFAGHYPWWPIDGGPGPVAREVDADSFDLAPIGVGRADWTRAIRHYRCPAAAD